VAFHSLFFHAFLYIFYGGLRENPVKVNSPTGGKKSTWNLAKRKYDNDDSKTL